MAKIKKELTAKQKSLRREILNQMLTLSSSSLGLVAALAWNEVIKESITLFIKPFFGVNSSVISLLIYALVITVFVVFVTYNLSKFKETV